jgi:hypothetical protein
MDTAGDLLFQNRDSTSSGSFTTATGAVVAGVLTNQNQYGGP